ncbi:catenin delta-2 isoform X1 [Adelges cooleyi]|uniref:catenin delta-2 isoform X1 n=1 Tax=Adelges cooleyi TaxID=133065 RepID=UPI00217F7165|nr:catenin delta-2 isoform X1 [Adelges cooleyi]XP_050438188.1 catenin delta-2 isoform X1 [Adelges cooleyi]XP_050438189.1 catenin delta-2 isoform X1 [Adelges cooleyi]
MSNQLVDSCLLVNRRVEKLQEQSFTTCTEITQRSQTDLSQNNSYSNDITYSSNGLPESHSANSSAQCNEKPLLVSQTKKHQTTQQVTTVTKVVREVHHMIPNGHSIDYIPYTLGVSSSSASSTQPNNSVHMSESGHFNNDYQNYNPGCQDYDHYVGIHSGLSYSNYNNVVGQQGAKLDGSAYQMYDTGVHSNQHGHDYNETAPTPPSPSACSESPPPQQLLAQDYIRKGLPYPPSGYEELDTQMHPNHDHYHRITPSPGDCYDQMSSSWNMDECGDPMAQGLRWRDPNLPEVITFLANPNNLIKANAAAYLQHLCYMDDQNKQKTRALGGIPALVKLLNHDCPDVYRNACGALRNLSYGRQNDENKRAIKDAGGIPLLINLLHKSADAEVKELVTGVLWNLSSCEDLKKSIIDDGLSTIVNQILIPHSGWSPTACSDICWSTVFRNTSGVLRNISSAGEYARRKLRECEHLIDSLLYVISTAVEKSNIGNKSVENCVCILRNLSYRCQEVEDPNYDKHPLPTQSRVGPQPKGENLGCFGASKKKKDIIVSPKENPSNRIIPRTEPAKGMELLWQPEVVQSYLALLQSCSNPETLEAAAGAIQNLAACYWQPSIEIRAAVRKEKGLPILVELLRMEVDRVVCAVATALRNLAIDQRNKELIGKYAMRDLVQKLPSGNAQHDQGTSDDTIAAVLATLNEVIKKNAEFARSLLDSSGVERLMNIVRQRQKYTSRVLKFASQVLFAMWQHQELRDAYKKHGWREQDFVTKTIAARNAAGGVNSPNNANSTLNRPMASQGGTRYEDRTIQRQPNPNVTSQMNHSLPNSNANSTYQANDDIPLADMPYPEVATHTPPVGGVLIYPPGHPLRPGEPLYAQVNREKKKNKQYDPSVNVSMGGEMWNYNEQAQPKVSSVDVSTAQGGDSWV